jgi:hypothetical protein
LTIAMTVTLIVIALATGVAPPAYLAALTIALITAG